MSLRRWVVALVAAGALAAAFWVRAAGSGHARPNVLIIVTDDQRTGTLSVMPATRRYFGAGGKAYRRGFVTTPVCCPARASIMSGRYAHNSGVETLLDASKLDQGTTIQAYLSGAGYRTALVGKYLNLWSLSIPPPHFDSYALFDGGYFHSLFNVNGEIESAPRYSTDYISDHAVADLKSFESDDSQPWLLYIAPFAPHALFEVGPHYRSAPVPRWPMNPADVERDVSDKPAYVTKDKDTLRAAARNRRHQLRTLMSVDDMVARIFSTMDGLNENNTIAFYLSDNGWLWHEHSFLGKRPPYPQSVHVPFLMRWPGHVSQGVVSDRLVTNLDIAPTVLQAAGLKPDNVMDGSSLLDPHVRDRLLLEQWIEYGPVPSEEGEPVPTWASTWTPDHQYVEYYGPRGQVFDREYYDLRADPWELYNLLGDDNPDNDPNIAALSKRLRADRHCAGTACP